MKTYSLDEASARRLLSDVSAAVAEMIMHIHPAKDADHATRLIEIVDAKIRPLFALPCEKCADTGWQKLDGCANAHGACECGEAPKGWPNETA